MVAALVAGVSVMSSGSVLAAGVEVTCIPVAPVLPNGATLWSYNGSGTFEMGAGTSISRIVVFLEEKRADGIWYPHGTKNATHVVNAGSNPETGTWSVTFNTTYNPNFSYKMMSQLYKKKPNGAHDPAAVTTSLNPVWKPVPVAAVNGVE